MRARLERVRATKKPDTMPVQWAEPYDAQVGRPGPRHSSYSRVSRRRPVATTAPACLQLPPDVPVRPQGLSRLSTQPPRSPMKIRLTPDGG